MKIQTRREGMKLYIDFQQRMRECCENVKKKKKPIPFFKKLIQHCEKKLSKLICDVQVFYFENANKLNDK